MDDPQHVAVQYADPRNLGARADLHERFSCNPYGWYRWVFDRIERLGPSTVLDVGCGPGGLWRSEEGRADALSVTLCDRSEGMVATARSSLGGSFGFAVADAQQLPFASGSFDVVVSMHMLYHVPDREAAVAEFARVLVAGGTLFAATNGPRHMPQLNTLLALDRMTPGFDLESGRDVLATSFDDVSMERYEDSLRVTDADAVVAYVRSMHEFWPGALPSDALRSHVQGAIDREGAFVIDKDPGMFTAVRG
jgi:SAM-dependent methyltransferase